jgi:hypothetical protein
MEENPYRSPLNQSPATSPSAESQRSSGCALPFLSFLVFYTFQDQAIVDSLGLRACGLAWLAGIVLTAPLFCVVAWIIVFHAPLGNRFRLAPLLAIRRIPVVARHVLLWVALIATVLLFHYAFGVRSPTPPAR